MALLVEEQQDGRFRVRFQVVFLENFKWHIPSVRIQWSWGPLINRYEYQGISWGVKCSRHVGLTILPNVRIWMEAQHSIYPPNLRDLLRESFTFIPIRNFMTVSIFIILESFTIAICMLMKFGIKHIELGGLKYNSIDKQVLRIWLPKLWLILIQRRFAVTSTTLASSLEITFQQDTTIFVVFIVYVIYYCSIL